MVVSFWGLNSQNRNAGSLTRRSEGFPRHQFSTLYRSLLPPLSLILLDRFTPHSLFRRAGFYIIPACVLFIPFVIGLIRKPTSFVSETSRAAGQRGK
ncbi:hypothetical protein ABRZ24_04710 [Brenneria populi]|uniref:Uncharacterized protein n=1 Tax=Brenneria populi TaxID=1505588 RepID=A0ABU6JMW9_9GAMM|nr:hypothetical protein [Brenneria populi Li et al. 2015]